MVRELTIPSVALLLSKYGLLILAVGTLIEGETVLLVAGALASRGVLSPAAVWVVAASGAWLGHAMWFGLGRLVGRERIVALLPRWEPVLAGLDAWILKRPWVCIFWLQYLYGMRLPGAVALGFSSLPVGWFLAAEAVNCLIWAALVGTLGYVLGESAGAVLRRFGRVVWVVASACVVAVVLYRLIRYSRSRGGAEQITTRKHDLDTEAR